MAALAAHSGLNTFAANIESFKRFRSFWLDADLMHPSKIGSGFISSSLDANVNTRRTSASLLLDGMVAASHPGFAPPMKAVQAAAWRLTGQSVS